MDKWLVARIVKGAVESVKFLEREDRACRAARVAKEIGVSRSTLYAWGKVAAAQVPSVIEFSRLLHLASARTRAWALTEFGRPLGVEAEIRIEGKVADPTKPIWDDIT